MIEFAEAWLHLDKQAKTPFLLLFEKVAKREANAFGVTRGALKIKRQPHFAPAPPEKSNLTAAQASRQSF